MLLQTHVFRLTPKGSYKCQRSLLFRLQNYYQFEDFLLEEGIVSRESLLHALETLYDVPAIDIEGQMLDHHLVRMFPKDVLLRNYCVPYQRDGDVLVVVAAHPDDADLPLVLGKYVSYDITFMVGIPRHIADEAKEFYDRSLTDFPRSDGQ